MLRVLAPLLILASVLAKPEQTLVSLIKRYKDVASLGPHLGDKAAMVNEAEDGRLPLVVAVQQDNKAAVSLLLQYGASLSQSEGRAGHSAMSAALTGNTSDDIVRLLLQYGPDLDMQYNGKSLRTYAKPKAQKLIAQYDDHGAAAFEVCCERPCPASGSINIQVVDGCCTLECFRVQCPATSSKIAVVTAPLAASPVDVQA